MAFTEQDRNQLREMIWGCWMGKNCGGTLGGPLERAWGQDEPFDVWWYPRLQEGGIPNDDLEMQLVWLKALEEIGPRLDSHHLAQYWLTHILYNPDEYGLCKTNLRLGLLPPVAGHYNNWFKDCMGCPIRTEIWACIAPGHPRIAVRYTYEDSIVDHAGGESIWGAFFNTAVESAAFVVRDRDQLLDIGLSYVPQGTRTRAAIEAAVDAHRQGISDWREARRRVMAAAPHYVAQYSPINIGFQVVGWLYGDDFGDALCKAVNCGYDTDCTGATLGAFLGILLGRQGLPQKWTAPLGESIATSESNGGLRHTLEPPNPVPANLGDLTERTIRMAERVLGYHGVALRRPGDVDVSSLYADDAVFEMARSSPTRIYLPAPTVDVAIDYLDSPAVRPGQRKRLDVILRNPHAEEVQITCAWRMPQGWPGVAPRSVQVPALGSVSEAFEVDVPSSPRLLENSNELLLQVVAGDRPAVPAIPVRLIGASRWRVSEIVPLDGRSDREVFDAPAPPETASRDLMSPDARPGTWRDLWALDNNLPIDWPVGGGTVYAQMFLHAHTAREIWLGVAANCPAKVFVNGALSSEQFMYRPIRPNYDGGHDGKQQTYGPAEIRAGWNEVLIKCVRTADAPPFASHVVVCEKAWHRGATTLLRTRLPWE